MKKNKIYGYMIGYRELGSRFVRYYTTFTHKSALSCLYAYRAVQQGARRQHHLCGVSACNRSLLLRTEFHQYVATLYWCSRLLSGDEEVEA